MKKNYLYKTTFGYIVGKDRGSYYYIDEFVVYARYRGKGYARKLAEFLPKKCMLIACPIRFSEKAKYLKTEELVNFYKSLGFSHTINKYGHNVMYRGMAKPASNKSESL